MSGFEFWKVDYGAERELETSLFTGNNGFRGKEGTFPRRCGRTVCACKVVSSLAVYGVTMKIWLSIVSLICCVFGFGCQTLQKESVSHELHIGHKEIFASADLNADGKLSHQEVAAHHHEEELREFDLDNDNHISRSEWAAAHPSSAQDDQHFNNVDKDSDGHISRGEAVLFVTEHISFSDTFRKYDQNGDFHLHWEEIDEGAPTELNITLFSIQSKA